MKHETPRDADGAKVCAWCGGPIKQSGVGRSRDYCGRTHRELAYRERATQKRIAQALADASPVSSVDDLPGQRDTSTDEIRGGVESSTDETELPPLPPLLPIPFEPIREPSPDLDARLDALAGPEPDDSEPVLPVRRPALSPPPRRARRRSGMTASPMPLPLDET